VTVAKITVKLPQFQAVGFYRIGGLLFRDGVAETDELSNSDREIIAMIGAEVEGEEPKAPVEQDEEREPAGATPPADDAADAPVPAGETEDEAPAAPEAPQPTSSTEDEAPASSSSFVDPTPTTDAQAAAAPFEVATVSSSTDGSTTETVGSEV
jgi:hypothetical protein